MRIAPPARPERVALVLAGNGQAALEDLVRPLAGAPLLVRQLEWLRRAGIARAFVNRVPTAPLPDALSSEALAGSGVRVSWIPSSEPLDPRELARRAGLRNGVACVVPHALVGDVDLDAGFETASASRHGVHVACGAHRVRVQPLPFVDGRVASVIVVDGWLRDLAGEPATHALVEAALAHAETLGIAVRGTRAAPGVFRARGSRVARGATLVAPCLLGPDTFVAAGAIAGPGAVLDAGAVLEAGAVVVHARVAADVVVGQGIRIERACALPGRIARHEGRELPVDDQLLLGTRTPPSAHFARLLAVAALSLTAPMLLVDGRAGAIARRLARVAGASGAWLGPRRPDDPDAVVFDLASRLAPRDAPEDERAAACALYARSRTWRTDVRVLLGGEP